MPDMSKTPVAEFDEWTATLPSDLTFDERLDALTGWLAAQSAKTK